MPRHKGREEGHGMGALDAWVGVAVLCLLYDRIADAKRAAHGVAAPNAWGQEEEKVFIALQAFLSKCAPVPSGKFCAARHQVFQD